MNVTRPRGAATAEGTGSRRRRLLLNASLVVASVTIGSGMAEALVRGLAPQALILKRPDIWQPLDTLGWVHRPHVSTDINTGERTVHVFTDAEGFRVGAAGRVKAEQRILLLGDSFMEAFQVEYEQSTSGLLESRLARRLGTPVAVRNTAVGGWDPPQYLVQARRSLEHESFDLVMVALYLGNDLVEASQHRPPRTPAEVHPFRLPRRLALEELSAAVLYPVNDFLEVRSHLFVLLKNQTETLRMRLGLSAAYFPEQFRMRDTASARWHVTAGLCREIVSVAERHGTQIVFVLIPAVYQVDRAVFDSYVRGFEIDPTTVDVDQPNRLLGESLRAAGLTVVDLLPYFRAAHDRGAELYGKIDPHLSPQGHEILASILEPKITASLARPAGDH